MEKWGGQPKAPSEIMEDRIHAIRINLLDDSSKSSSEIANGLVLLLEDGLQRTDVSLLSNSAQVLGTNATNNSLNELIYLCRSLWNQAKEGPFKLAGNTLHSKQLSPALSIMALLKCSMRSYGSEKPSYMEKDGMTKPRGSS